MKNILHILLFFAINIIYISVNAQDPPYPTATIISEDVEYCGSEEAEIEIQFTGTTPSNFALSINGDISFWEVDITKLTSELLYSFTLPFPQTSEIAITRVYDNNYQYDVNNPMGSGVENSSNSSMIVQIDEMPSPNAGTYDAICGYELTLDGTVTDQTHTIYWNDLTGVGDYSDVNSPTSKFTADQEGDVTFILTEINGMCTAKDEVTVTFLGAPTAALNSSGEFKFCSSDSDPDFISMDIAFTGNAPFNYKINEGDYTSDGATDNPSIEVFASGEYSITEVTDVNGCYAPAEDITGTQIVTDLKPVAYAGEDQIICGKEFTLEATPSSNTSGEWTSKSVGINYADATNANTTVTSDDYQLVTLTWTETSDEMNCVSTGDDVQIRFAEPPVLELSKTEDEICDDGSSFSYLTLNVTNGNEPFSVFYNDESKDYSESDLTLGVTPLKLYPEFNSTESPQSITRYNFTSITGAYGCTTTYSDLTYTVKVDEKPEVSVVNYIQDIPCNPIIELEASTSFGTGYWSFESDGTFDDENNPYTKFTATTSKDYILIWNDTNGECTTSSEVAFSVLPFPDPVFAGIDSIIYGLDKIQLYAEPLNIGKGTWSLLEGYATIENTFSNSSVVSGMDPGVYKFLWSTDVMGGGCTVKDTVVITIKELFQTGGFSPNGDAVNEYFEIPGSVHLTNIHFVVFDKLGKLKYEEKGAGSDHEIKWDGVGIDGEALPAGVYYYVFEADELSKPVKKYLVLKR